MTDREMQLAAENQTLLEERNAAQREVVRLKALLRELIRQLTEKLGL